MPPYYGASSSYSAPVTVANVMKSVYAKMTLGLVVTALVSLLANVGGFVYFMAMHSFVYWALIIAELGIVFYLSSRITRMSTAKATGFFYLFAALNGLALSSIFVVYTGVSIAKTFFITAGTFGAMSVYGYSTNRDLSKMGSLLFMALIGIIIASLVNMFLHSSGLETVISFVGVLLFVGLTAWDTQQIKNMIQVMPSSSAGQIATLGALSLYLDFINLFLYLLRFFGNNRD